MSKSLPRNRAKRPVFSAFTVAAVLLCAGGCYIGAAQANPSGGGVAGGSASIAGQGSAQVTVTQSTDRAAINWDSFSVGAGERTDFIQPSRNSITLNRVTGGSASQIFGAINANGTVILSNRNGILIGESGSVNAGGFVATTHDVDTASFMSGANNLRFTSTGTASGTASVVNEGAMTIAEAGLAAFVAPSVKNSGTIVANLGRVALGSGHGFTLDLYGDQLVSFTLGDRIMNTLTLADGTPLKALVENNGSIKANGGRIALTAVQARDVVNQAVNTGGVLAADTVAEKNGVITLSAHDGAGQSSGTIVAEAGATISAQGDEAGTKGGTITASAQSITLESGSVISADGAAGGGTVNIGGGYQGGGTILHAERVTQKAGAKITANATTTPAVIARSSQSDAAIQSPTLTERTGSPQAASSLRDDASGAGGQVVLWSDTHTQMDGTIEAKGQTKGGSVETSSKGTLGLSGKVDASAANGTNGEWLLDPSNVTIGAAGTSVPVGGGVTNPNIDSYTILASSISAALNAGNNVTITTTNAGGTQAGDITVNSAISKTAGGDATLTLKADQSIYVNSGANITSTSGKLNTVLWADSDNSSAGAISISGATITSNGGNVTMAGGLDDGANGGTAGDGIPDGYAWGVSGNVRGVYIYSGGINTGSGNILARGHGWNDAATSGLNGIQNNGALQSTTGNVSLYGVGGDGTSWNMGVVNNIRIETVSGNIALTGTGGNGSSGYGYGIHTNVGSQIISTGTGAGLGSITLTGKGGATSNTNFGVALYGGTISSVDSSVFIYGNAGLASYGLMFWNNNSILSSGAAAITLTASGGFAPTSYAGYTNTIGGASSTGNVSIISDSWAATHSGTLSVQTSGNIIVKPYTPLTTIGLNGGAGGLGLDSIFLNSLHPGNKLIIGDSAAGTGLVTVNGWDLRGQSYNTEVYGGAITFATNDVLWNGANNLLFAASTGDINIAKSFTKSGGADSNLTFKASNSIIASTATISSSSNKLNTVLWSDSDASSAGAISLTDTQITSNGGNVTLAGGLDNGANGGTAGDGVPDGYAWGTAATTDGVLIAGGGVNTGSGNILARGRGYNNAGAGSLRGVNITGAGTIQTTSGNASFYGIGGNGLNTAMGVNVSSLSTRITTATGSILLTGTGGAGTSVSNYGVWLSNSALISSTGTGVGAGTITLIGQGGGTGGASSNNLGVGFSVGSTISSVDGAISITGTGGINSDGIGTYNNGASIISTGQASITLTGVGNAGSDLRFSAGAGYTDLIGGPSAAGDVSLVGNTLAFVTTGTLSVQTTGNITYKPRTPTTTIGLNGGAGTLQLTNSLLSSLHPGNKLIIGDSAAGTGLVTINGWDLRGQSYNTEVYGGAITFATNDVLWNGANNLLFAASTGDINIAKSFTKSGGADSNLTFKASNSIIASTATISSSSNKLNTVLWSDSDASSAGAISLTNTQITSNGGNVTLAGGLDNGANGGTAGDGTPDGYAWGTAGNNYGAYLYSSSVNTGTGNILVRGHALNDSATGYLYGVYARTGSVLQTSSGDISLYGIGGNGVHWNVGTMISSSSISTGSGNVRLTGTGGSSSTDGYGYGVELISTASIISTGTGGSSGSISLEGYGASSSIVSMGVALYGGTIQTVDAPISICGQRGLSGSGVYFYYNNNIRSTGTASILLTSNGGTLNPADGSGYSNTIGGPLASGNIEFVTDQLVANPLSALSVQTTGNITIKPRTASATIGVNGGAGGLSLSSTLLDSLHAGGRVIIGDSTSGTITANAYNWNNNVSLYSGAGITLNGAQTMGAYNLYAQTYGASDITLGASGSVSSTATGDAITLASQRNFVNNAGAGALSASSGRWLVYASGTAGNTFNNLNSGNTAVWNTANGAAVAQTGNRYVFAQAPTATLTTSNLSKTYGADNSASLPAAYTVSGLSAGVANAFAADTASSAFSGAPVITSAGATNTAHVAGSPYAINIAAGSVAGINGYATAFASSGLLTVNKAALTITADDASKVYGAANPTYTASYSGFVNGEDNTILSTQPTVQSAAAGAAPHVGGYGITASGAAADDYLIAYVAGTFTVTRAALTITADDKSKIYGAANPALTASYSGFVNGDTTANITTLPTLGTAAGALSNTGSYAITAAGAVDGDYTFTYVNGALSITPRLVTVGGSFTAADRIFNGTTSATIASNNLFLTGVPAGDEANIVLNAAASFDTLLIGSNKLVSVSTASFLSGSAAGNYAISLAGAPTTTASITNIPHAYTASIMESISSGGETPLVLTDRAALDALFPVEIVASTSPLSAKTDGKVSRFFCILDSKDSRCSLNAE